MADKKISELDAITGANTAADDFFVVVDTSGSVTKKISRAELNNAIEQDVLSTVDINGGTIDNTVIGGTTAAAGSFTNVTVSGTVDGRDVASDGTKLDGIEASADVTDATNVAAAGALMTSGGTMSGDLNFGDNDKAIFGAGSDLHIYHDASESIIEDVGNGDLKVRGSDEVKIQVRNAANTAWLNAVVAADAGAVTLSHNNSAKLATTATGVDVTGLITTDAITETSAGKVGIGTVSPPQKFVVSNAGADNIVMSENSSASIQMFMQATSGTGSVGTLTNHDVQFLANNSEKARITSFGDVGIGRSDPQNIVGNSGGGLVVRSGASRAATTTAIAFQDSSGNNMFSQLHNGQTIFSTGAVGSKTEAMHITSAGDVLGTDFVMTFNPSFPPAGTGTYYQNGAITSTDGSLINTLAPCNFKIKELKVYVNGALSSGSATVAILKDGSTTGNLSIGTGTNVHSLTSFLANNSFSASSNNRIGARIIISGASAAWYHISIRCERI